MKTLINATLYDFVTYKQDAYIRFDQKIIEVGSMSKFKQHPEDDIIDAKNHIVMPGLICGHTHIYSALARGMILPFDPKNFQDILDQLWWKMDAKLDLKMIEHSALIFGIDFIKNGVTTIIDHHASGKGISGTLQVLKKTIVDELGMRGAFAFETSDRFDVNEAIKENKRFIQKHQDDMTRGLFGLHASSSLSDASLKMIAEQLDGAPIHIHVAESIDDELKSVALYGKPIVHRLAEHGLLKPKSILAHAIHVNDEELDLMRQHHITVAVNFSSNMNNGVGIPALKRFSDKQISVIIGNDGISQSMTTEYLMAYFATRHLDQTPNHFGLNELKDLIINTYRYAADLFGVKLGRLEQNYEADLLLVPYVPPTPMHQNNILGHLFFGLFSSFKPKEVFIKGKHLLKAYQVDPKWMIRYQDSQKEANRLWHKLGVKSDA